MASRTRKSNADTVYVSEPPLRQRVFPARRQTRRSIASSTSLTEKERKKQQTLTQIKFPFFLSDDEDDEVEESQEDFGVLKREPVAAREEESEEEWEQPTSRHKRRKISFGPPPLRSSNSGSRRGLIGKERGQQTLTQAGYLLRFGAGEMPDSEEDDAPGEFELYEDDDGVKEHGGGVPEEFKIVSGPEADIDTHVPAPIADSPNTIPSSIPRTPRHRKTLEVPSSQSPADVPLSTQSVRSWRTAERSPLREYSSNILFIQAQNPRAKLSRVDISGKDDGDQAKTPSELAQELPPRPQLVHMHTIQDSEDGELDAELSLTRSMTKREPPTSSENVPQEASDADREAPWNDEVGYSALPQPRWSQLEQRDVTQYARSQVTNISIDEASEQLLQDMHGATQRVDLLRSVPDGPAESLRSAMRLVRPSQATTVDITQNNTWRSQLPPAPLTSSPAQTSPPQARLQTRSPIGKEIEVQVPSSPHLMLPPNRNGCGASRRRTEDPHRRITFSQLVPESLRNESFYVPPSWSQEDDEL